jgi:AcrR family transcriptional regulator
MRELYAPGDRPAEDLTNRARIRDAAMVEFAEKGYRGATMKSIAAAAGVSVGLVQHHFGTKDELRKACDEVVSGMIRTKVDALDAGTLTDPAVLSGLMALAPLVQHYVGRALVDGSEAMQPLIDDAMSQTEAYLTSSLPERFPVGEVVTRDAAAVMAAVNTSIMVLQPMIARRMGIAPWTDEAIMRIGTAMLDVFEAIADMVSSDFWREFRSGLDAYEPPSEEKIE